MLNRTSPHMWGRCYLPIFLFGDGLLTLMYIASFISLMRFWSSLPSILKFSSVVIWPVVLKWLYTGEGAFKCSLNLSPNVLEDSYVFPITFHPVTFEHLYMMPLFFVIWSLSLGATWRSLMVLPPLQCTCISCFLHTFFILSPRPFVYGTTI